MSQVWKAAPVKDGELLILLALSDYADDDGNCYPAVSTLADKARMTKRNAQRCLRSLAEMGLLKIDENSGPKGCNRYVVLVANLSLKPAEKVKSGDDKLSPYNPADGGDICDTGGVTSATGGDDAHVTRTVIEPSLEPSRERERASADAHEGGEGDQADEPVTTSRPETAAELEKRVMRFCTGEGYQGGEWPKWVGSSPTYIKRRFAELSTEDQQAAERWRDAFLAKAKAQGVKTPMPVGNYFRDKAWQGLTETEMARAMAAKQRGGSDRASAGLAEAARPEGWAVAMGPVFSACLHSVLLKGPEHPEHAPDGNLWLSGHLSRAWPKMAGLHQLASMKRGVVLPPRLHALRDSMEFVPDGGNMWAAWEAEYKARNWPMWPRHDGMKGMYFPAGGPEGLAAFEQAVAGQTHNNEAAE